MRLGGAVLVVQRGPQRAEPPPDRLRHAELLPGRHHLPEPRGRRPPLRHLLQRHRGEEAPLHPLRLHEPEERVRVVPLLLRRDHQRPPRRPGGEDLLERHVEAGGGELERPRGARPPPLPHLPGQEVGQRPVRHRHPLGPSGGARGVDHVRQALRVGLHEGGAGGLLRDPLPQGVHAQHLRPRGRERTGQLRLRQEHRRAGVPEHVGQPLRRVRRVQGDVAAPRPEHGQDGDHQLVPALHAHPHPPVRPDAAAREEACEPAGAPLQLRVGERPLRGHHRGGVGGPRRLRLDQAVDGEPREFRGGGAPLLQHPRPLRPGEGRQLREPPVGVVGHLLQEHAQVLQHPVRRRRVEAVPVVAEVQDHVLADGHLQHQRVAQRRPGGGVVHVPQLQPGHASALHLAEGEVLEEEEGVEEPLPRGDPAPLLDLPQREVVVLPRPRLVGLDLLEPGRQRRAGVHAHAHGDRPQEHPQRGVRPREGRRPPGRHRSEDHVVLARVAGQEDGPRSLEQGVEGELAPLRGLPQPLRERGGERGLGLPRGLLGPGVVGMAHGERGRRLDAGQGGAPEALGVADRLRLEPGDVRLEGRRRVEDGDPARAEGVVEGEQLPQRHARGPAVQEEVVAAPRDPVRPLAGAHARHAEERRGLQVEAAPLRAHQAPDALLPLGGRHVAPVAHLHPHLHLLPHHLERGVEPLPEEDGAQDGLAVHERLPGALEGRRVEVALHGPADLLRVLRHLRGAERAEQDVELHGGERVDALYVLHSARLLDVRQWVTENNLTGGCSRR